MNIAKWQLAIHLGNALLCRDCPRSLFLSFQTIMWFHQPSSWPLQLLIFLQFTFCNVHFAICNPPTIIGTHLVNETLKQLSAAGVQLIFVLGYPNYYSRFGFVPAGARGLQAPYPIPEQNADAWMVVELQADAVESFNGEVKCCKALDHQKYWVE